MKISDAEIPSLLFDEQVSDPATPGSGLWRAYMKSDGIYIIDDAGAVTGPIGTVAGPIYSAWTPALTAVTTNPTLGSGSTAVGRYFESGKHVVGYGAFTFGSSGVAAGSGTYIVSLPTPSRARANNDMNMIGTGYIFDSSASAIRPVVFLYNDTGTVTMRLTTDGSTVNNSAPWTWAASDVIVFHFDYEAA